jgi:hypothetical protein
MKLEMYTTNNGTRLQLFFNDQTDRPYTIMDQNGHLWAASKSLSYIRKRWNEFVDESDRNTNHRVIFNRKLKSARV